uniref:DUF4283 domain-containing protein n=1 Tax=Tanacetum cinerariifolium TaxID=118510 RepID=A0A6L2MCC0_TANCI|nr:hypothetical protein [Tanacetum cinerariifolium]
MSVRINDEASMEDPGTRAKEGDVTGLDQSGMETGEVTERNEVRTAVNEEKMNKMQKESNNEVNKNLNLDKNDDITSVLNEKHDNTNNDRSMGSNTDNQDFEGKSYANVLRKDETSINKNLIFISPKITDDGDVKVLFDEAIVNKECAKWKFTICGHFIGQNMSYYELRDEIGMKQVLDQGPWLIRNRPMFVQKWDPEIGMEKPEPKTIPIWVKLVNIPIEGWSMEGISALASSLGTPKVMDEKTAQMCQFGVGRTHFARVLVEIEVNKDLQEVIKIEYIGENKDVKGTKLVNVMYDWKPERKENVGEGNKNEDRMRNMEKGDNSKSGSQNQRSASPKTQNKEQNVNKNKFSVLDEENTNESNELRILKDREVVDQFLNKRMQPTCKEASCWTKDMVKYFHDQWKIDRLKENEDQGENVEDVYENGGGIAQAMTADNVIGDFNVTLKMDEHSSGGSRVSNDMQDFIDCVNEVEMEDLCSNGVFYTWIKSPLNPQNSVLKKLDRVMVNEEFCLNFPTANALLLPYMVSDHSPIVVSFPLCFEKKKSSFKFTNFIVEKEEFIPIVDSGWKTDIHGCKMLKPVKKMKSIKGKLKDLSWKNGNLHELVENCRQKVKVAQVKLDKNPHDKDAKKDEIKALIEYNEVVHDEESPLAES